MTNQISGVILAGGAGKRFSGRIKSNIEIGGETIISRIINTINDLFDEVIIVTNNPGEFADYSNYKITGDHILNAGPLGGIHAGLKASSNKAVFVFAGDMPLLSRRLIINQIDFYNRNQCEVTIPLIAGEIEPLHSIYSGLLISRIEDYLLGDNGCSVREFIKLTDVRYMSLEASAENKNVFTNVNSQADISVAEKILSKY